MSIDPNILPEIGTWNGIKYSRRYQDLITTYSSSFLIEETDILKQYMPYAYCTYVGGEGILQSGSAMMSYNTSNNEILIEPGDEYHPTNIGLAVLDTDSVWGLYGYNRMADESSFYGYLCPVLSFDPNKICINLVGIVANVGQSDMESEGFSTSTVDFYNLQHDEVYAGIMENGVSNDGTRFLYGWYPDFYIGTETSRQRTDRLACYVESAPPAYSGWAKSKAFYRPYTKEYGNLSGIRQNSYDFANNYSGYLTATAQIGLALRRENPDSPYVYILDSNASMISKGMYQRTPEQYNHQWWGDYGYDPDSNIFWKWGRWSSYPTIYQYISGNDVLKTAAGMGLYFTTIASKASSGVIGALCTDPDIHIGTIDNNGYTDGSYVSGADAARAKQASWSNAVADAEAAGYVPMDPAGQLPYIDPSHYDDDNATVFPLEGYVGNTAKLYPLQYGQVTSLLTYLNNTAANLESENEALQKFLTNNPIDIISGIMYYPVDIFEIATDVPAAADNIILGNVETDVSARRLRSSTAIYNAGKCIYYPPDGLNDFRSYAPYSSAELYIPYCGSVKIDPADYIGHEISVKYLIDLATGACIALVLRDKLVLDSIAGQIGVQLPISGVQTASLQAAQHQATMQAQSAKVAAAAAIIGVGAAFFTAGSSLALTAAAVGGATALYGAAQKIEGTEYQLEHQEIPYKGVGTSTSTCSMQNEQACRLVIHRPIMLDEYSPRIYGKTKGFSCLLNVKLSEVSGYTQVSNADLSGIDASEAEKELLLSIMQSGFYM